MSDNSRIGPVRNGRGPMMGVEVCSDTDRSRVVLIGELDLASAPHLQRVLDELHRDGFQEIVLDLARLDFLSATGLEVFVHTDDQLRATGGRLILSRPGPRARRILAITGLDTVLTVLPVASGALDPAVSGVSQAS
ncbi:MAG TPA: STAS domain-containing protein [Pseudonocardiaceae bacterium]|nr:STAS domain-containing protein [Pseudonocardiaceae bacterium]